MADEERFDREEISKILKIASELDHRQSLEPENDTLTREELEQVAGEVGIDPLHLHTAIEQFKEDSVSAAETESASFFTYKKTQFVPVEMPDEMWDEIVTEIRRVNGGIGKSDRLGNTFEWEQRKRDVGYLQVSVTPKNDRTRIRINSSYRYYSFITQMIGGVFGFMIAILIGDDLASAFVPEWIFRIFGALGGVGIGRIYARNWMKKKRKMFKNLMDRLVTTISGVKNEPRLSAEIDTSDKGITEPLPDTDQSDDKESQAPPAKERNRT